MPTLQYRCDNGHLTEQFFRTITAGWEVKTVQCPHCKETAVKVFSVPLAAHLYGEPSGYSKPSPTKRFTTKTVSRNTGNDCAIG